MLCMSSVARGAVGFSLPMIMMIMLLGWIDCQTHGLKSAEKAEPSETPWHTYDGARRTAWMSVPASSGAAGETPASRDGESFMVVCCCFCWRWEKRPLRELCLLFVLLFRCCLCVLCVFFILIYLCRSVVFIVLSFRTSWRDARFARWGVGGIALCSTRASNSNYASNT